MKQKRYTEEQIAFALRQHDSGTPVAEITRKMGISEQSFYRWKKKYAGLGVAELRRLKQLEEENWPGGLGRLLAPGSHRAGRARLTHPVPLATVSLRSHTRSGQSAVEEAESAFPTRRTSPM